MKQIRNKAFETNSSSTHCLVLTGESKEYFNSFIPDKISFGEFGWGYETLSSAQDKLSYIVTLIQYVDKDVKSIPSPSWDDPNRESLEVEYSENKMISIENSKYLVWLKELVLEKTGKSFDIEKLDSEYYDFGYIDHQSLSPHIFYKHGKDIFSMEEKDFKDFLFEVIFTDNYLIEVDNDNRERN